MLNFLQFNRQRRPQPTEMENTLISHYDLPVPPHEHGNAYQKLFQLFHDIHDYTTLSTRRNVILIYVFLLLLYIGMNFALLGLNFMSQDFIEQNYYLPFHMLSFWGVFLFTLLEAFILISADIVNMSNYLQAGLVLFNILTTLTTAIIFSMFPHHFEVPAHYMEYSAQIFVSCVNIIFTLNFIRQKGGAFKKLKWLNNFRWLELIIALPIVMLSCLQIFIYAGILPITIEPERGAHFCEFSNALFALTYSVFIYHDLGKRMQEDYLRMYNFE
jgi:hypothetical protein